MADDVKEYPSAFRMLEAEYAIAWARMTLHPTLVRVVGATAKRLTDSIQDYAALSIATGVPIPFLMCVVEKDMRGRVPQPFDASHPIVAGLADITWSVPRCLFELERWDGWADRAAGRRSAYLWAGVDTQATPMPVFGAAPLLRRIIELDGRLRLPLGADQPLPVPPGIGEARRAPIAAPLPV